MKNLLILALLSLAALSMQAQTNVQYRITVDGVNTSWSYDASGNAKDKARIAGLTYAYGFYDTGVAVASGSATIHVLSLTAQ